jgi:sugar phosphate permease
VDWFATVAPTIRLVTNAVGRERSGIVYGWVFTVHQLGGASAAFFAGLFRIEFGTYMQAFMLSGLMCLFAAIAVLFIGRDSNLRERELAAAV